MIGDIVAALFIFYFVLPAVGATLLWLLGKVVYLFFPAPKVNR